MIIYIVQRQTIDGIYLFTDEQQAHDYAALFHGAEVTSATVLDAVTGRDLIERELSED